MGKDLLIGVVGPCKSGKTELKNGLEKLGYTVRHIAQEHSFVPGMWRIITNPDVLIYLDVSYENTLKRSTLRWRIKDYQEQIRRLEHAKTNADLIIDTDEMTIEGVLISVINFLKEFQLNSEERMQT